jgi:hypothetical protein
MKLPVVSGDEVVKVFRKLGYELDEQHGGHMILRHADPPHRQKGRCVCWIRESGLTVEEFSRLLQEQLLPVPVAWLPAMDLDRGFSNPGQKLIFRGTRRNNLPPAMTGIHLLARIDQSKGLQQRDIPPYRLPVALECHSKFRNRRRLDTHSTKDSHPLRREHTNQVGRILECHDNFGWKSLTAI